MTRIRTFIRRWLTSFIGGFVIGAGFALKLLGVGDEQALAMVLLTNMTTMILVVGVGLIILWRNGIDIWAVSRDLEAQSVAT